MSNIFHLTKTDYDEGVSFAIQQGSTFDCVCFFHPDNVSAWMPRGQIRSNYVDRGGVVKATFSFDPLVYAQQTIDGATAFRTKIRPKLTATQTQALQFDLKLRRTIDIPAIPGKNVWVYDIELQQNDRVIRLAQGWVEIDPEATR